MSKRKSFQGLLDLKSIQQNQDEVEERYRACWRGIYQQYAAEFGDHGAKKALSELFNVSDPNISYWMGSGQSGTFKMSERVIIWHQMAKMMGVSLDDLADHIYQGKPLGKLPGEVSRGGIGLPQISALQLLAYQNGNVRAVLDSIETAKQILASHLFQDRLEVEKPVEQFYVRTFKQFIDEELAGQTKVFVKAVCAQMSIFADRHSDLRAIVEGKLKPTDEELVELCVFMQDISESDAYDLENLVPDHLWEENGKALVTV